MLPYNKTNQAHQFLNFIFGMKLYMIRTVPLSIISSYSLYTQLWHVIQQDQDGTAVLS
jgi:hypothetical protein